MPKQKGTSLDCVIGIDTSCYTTSVSVVDSAGGILYDERRLLEVKTGQLGLRQSDAFFKHVHNLPELMENLFLFLTHSDQRSNVVGVAVSSRPRHVEGSYMPVFMAGLGFARTVSASLGVPLIETDHQSGHIMAGCLASPELLRENIPFLALHMSGGTTEIVKCCYVENHFSELLVGGTKDLSMGSLIDRIGVKCGMPFPSGASMEEKVQTALNQGQELSVVKFPVNQKDGWFNLSGMEAYGLKYIETLPHETLFYGLFKACAEVLSKALSAACQKELCQDVLIVGGVASNTFIREYLVKQLANQGIRVHLAEKSVSTDNAVGVAAIGCRQRMMTI